MILKVSMQYKKDLKRYQNKPSKIAALKEVLKHLKKSGSVPAAYKFKELKEEEEKENNVI